MAGKITDSFPEFASTSKLDDLRRTQYNYLEEQRHVYLDYAGSGLASRAQIEAHNQRLTSHTFGNPHSCSPTSQESNEGVEKTRRKILEFLNASPDEYAVIFTANATGALRLVGEAYPFGRSSKLVLTADNHNSMNGLREFARRRRAKTVYVPIDQSPDLTIDQAAISAALPPKRPSCLFKSSSRSLFAYPAQSNFTGVCHPLSWISLAQERGYDVLLDAAAYLPTHKLDLSKVHPEFVIVSWYKLFGFPTGVGSLVVRKSALATLSRPWFSGGTVHAVTTKVLWHALASDEPGFEDGTLNFLSIPDVSNGIDWLSGIGVDLIGTRVQCLTGWLLDRLLALRHSDGSCMARLYGPAKTENRGGTVSFNFLDASGDVVDCRLVGQDSAAAGISLRTGCFCNPGAGEAALGFSKAMLLPLSKKHKKSDIEEFLNLGLPTLGAVRVSLGIASTAADVDAFITFAEDSFRDRVCKTDGLGPRLTAC